MEIGAEDRGTLIQRDTYFAVARGRLKIREEDGAAAHLIAYERPDLAGHKESRYLLIDKARRFFVSEGVRIHLDRVDGLGDFIEFGGVAVDGADPGGFADLLRSLR